MRIIVACDSFKGSLSSKAIKKIARQTIIREIPTADVIGIEIADGGEGTLDALASVSSFAKRHICVVTCPCGTPGTASYLGFSDTRAAFI